MEWQYNRADGCLQCREDPAFAPPPESNRERRLAAETSFSFLIEAGVMHEGAEDTREGRGGGNDGEGGETRAWGRDGGREDRRKEEWSCLCAVCVCVGGVGGGGGGTFTAS